jgi:hypothetical protein
LELLPPVSESRWHNAVDIYLEFGDIYLEFGVPRKPQQGADKDGLQLYLG